MRFGRLIPTLMAAAAAWSLPGAVASSGALAEEVVNVYSYREPGLIEPFLKAFTEKTGIKVNLVFSKDGLVERMLAEGKNSPADVLLTNEFGFLVQAKSAGVVQPVASEVLERAIPAALRDPSGEWFALTRRARIVYAAKDRVKDEAITYEDLADPKWKGRICIRSGQHTYNIGLVASMIAHHGESKTEAWLTGVKNNLARKPAAGDREGVRDVHAGLCDIAIGNTYYMAAMLHNADQKAWADAVHIIFPNASDRGTHVNISGGAVAAHAPHKENAIKLLEYLASPEAQRLYAEKNGEYPAAAGIEPSDLVKSWGELKPDPLPLSKIAEFRKKASELIDKVRFDAGAGS